MEKERHVLVALAHPDDEAFGISGTILFHTEAGTPVTYACLTLGEMGRNMGKPLIANRETLPNIRQLELEKACELLGIEDLRQFGLRDKTVEFVDEETLIKRFADLLQEIKPSLVITFYPGYAVHPDHDATGSAMIKAVERLPKGDRPKVHAIAFSNGCEDIIGPPDIIFDIKEYAEKKMNVIAAHESQTAGMIQVMKEKYAENDESVTNRFLTERYWTYPLKENISLG